MSLPCQVAVEVANATLPQLEERLMEEAQRQNGAVEMAREAAMLEVHQVDPDGKRDSTWLKMIEPSRNNWLINDAWLMVDG